MIGCIRPVRNVLMIFGWAAMAIGMAGCGGGGGNGTTVSQNNPISVSGYVLKGDVTGATVRIREITTAGLVGDVIAGPFTTGVDGFWSGEVPSGTSGVYAVTASGGTYTDESTGNTVSLVSEIRGIIQVGQTNKGNVTPVTEAMFINAAYRMQSGAAKDAAFTGAISDMITALGFDPTSVAPPAGMASPLAVSDFSDIDIYKVILAGFSAILDANPLLTPAFDNAETWEIVKAVAADMSDGKLDGIDIVGNAVLVDDGSGTGTLLPLPALSPNDISNLIDAANAWAAVNFPGLVIPDVDISTFGNFTVAPPGGDFVVSGSLTVTGPDARLLGVADPGNTFLFEPTSVDIGFDSSTLSGIGTFVFYRDDIFNYIGVSPDPNGVREVVSVTAIVPGEFWITDSVSTLSVPGASVSQLGNTYTIRFSNVALINTATGLSDPAITLDGELVVSP